MNVFTKLGRVLLLSAVVAVGLAGCDDNGIGTGDGISWNNTCGKDGTAGSCKTVTIGGQTWMAENLNYQMADSWCYKNSSDSCAKYGRLYTWDAAMTACPSGWHLSTNQEWQSLKDYAAGDGSGWLKNLKSTSGWSSRGGNGTDYYGFSALPGGQRSYGNYSDGFGNAGDYGFWWTDEEVFTSSAVGVRVDYGWFVYSYGKDNGYSVRCVKD